MGLDIVELVISWEEEFGIDIPNGVAATLETPGKAIDWIYETLNTRTATESSPIWTHDQVKQVVRRLIMEQTGVKEFSDEDEFVRDLGLD